MVTACYLLILSASLVRSFACVSRISQTWVIIYSSPYCISKFDTHDTLPGCSTTSVLCGTKLLKKRAIIIMLQDSVAILGSIRHLYIALHEGTSAAPTASMLSLMIMILFCLSPRRTHCAISRLIIPTAQ
ncbi:hypothetical protein BGW80DRAFT_457200 [Lactifluus volemus]|nr:hypothetical protein BGW80DRAFT_457200 [Lactifluus volemus]